MKKRILVAVAALTAICIIFFIVKKIKGTDDSQVVVEVKKGPFTVEVVTTGELQARQSEDVVIPSGLNSVNIYQVKIGDIVTEGTLVKKDDHIATLDRTEMSSKMKDVESELQKIESQYTQTQLDTTIQLRTSRDELINLSYALDEKKVVVEQSQFEPPVVIKQAQMDYEKADRACKQTQQNYKLKVRQLAAKMQEIQATLDMQRNKHTRITELLGQFEIKAPKDGMVIYVKEWNGKKKGVGSTVSPWEPAVATLPDLTSMIVQTYVNEIDISKVKTGQVVKISIDAFAEKSFLGKITSVANVGEQRPNSDAKVFEVKMQVDKADPVMRPSMTTSNAIQISALKDVLYLPLECVHTQDSITYVYKKSGFSVIKQQIKAATSNSNEIVVERGLVQGDKVLLSVPNDGEKLAIQKI